MGLTTKPPENGWRNVFKMQSKKKSQVPNAVSGSQDGDPSNGEFASAVLAAAFAIHSLEEAKTPQNKNGKRTLLQSSTNKMKSAGEISLRRSTVQDHEGNGRLNSAFKPSRSPFVRPTPAADSWQKAERHEKLKSVLAWANEKKKEAKQKFERTKSETELKVAKKLASSLSK